MSKIQVGILCEKGASRDAIHQAIAPVVASTKLFPGEHVGADGSKRNSVGIVDPFLTKPVEQGQTFWLFLYPNSISQLRHDWQHPSFTLQEKINQESTIVSNQVDSIEWLREYAKTYLPLQDQWRREDECVSMGCDSMNDSFQEFIQNAKKHRIFYYGHPLNSVYDLQDRELLRHHLQNIMDIDIDFHWTGFEFKNIISIDEV